MASNPQKVRHYVRICGNRFLGVSRDSVCHLYGNIPENYPLDRNRLYWRIPLLDRVATCPETYGCDHSNLQVLGDKPPAPDFHLDLGIVRRISGKISSEKGHSAMICPNSSQPLLCSAWRGFLMKVNTYQRLLQDALKS